MALLRITSIACIGLIALAPTGAGAAATTTVIDIPTRGVTQRILHLRPDAPVANIVVVSGGDGYLGIRDDGTLSPTQVSLCGPVTRNRDAFVARGYGVALVDVTSDGSLGAYADLLEVVRYLRSRDEVPTWIIGASSATRAILHFAADLPLSEPMGAIFLSSNSIALAPGSVDTTKAAQVKRPALILYHANDGGGSWAARPLFGALTAAPAKEILTLSGGGGICGHHLFGDIDGAFVATVAGFIDKHNGTLVAEAPANDNYQGMWWNAPADSEPGWGINFAHQGDTIFATWFTFDADGKPLWLVVAATKAAAKVYAGTLYTGTGPAFDAVPFDPAAVSATPVGTATFTFADGNGATFAYTVNGVTQTKSITRQRFAEPVPTCVWGAGSDPAAATNYQDMWWNAPADSEPGWGINFAHQGNTIFATWFTYGADGKPLWLVVAATKTAPNVYAGTLYTGTGPPFDSVPFDPAKVAPTPVGTATFTFADGNSATFEATVNGIARTRSITRQRFSTASAVCQ